MRLRLHTLRFHLCRIWPAAGLLVLAACTTPPPTRSLPPPTPAVPGSAAGPLRGTGDFVWSPAMESAAADLRANLPQNVAEVVKTNDERIWILIKGENFEPGRGAVKPAAGPVLDRIAATLAARPRAQIRVVGHTDSQGATAANDALSVDRAASVRDWLVMKGVSPTRFTVAGRGSRDPMASNDTEAGRASNRRVELLVGEPATPAAK